ncbi:MAG: Na/Pi cotransporter family protein [Lachnospiraceae bacterium]|nr:Na/Pi cotransporter family protein [Lachnospiraceae bacterium]
MDIAGILSLIGGIALFLFGMSVMGDSLKKVAGSKMEVILYKLSGNTIKGVALGTGVTAVVQSSSAVSVMVVGFVNAGMMKVKQGISVVLGAILGTSITGWILCLNSLSGGKSSVASILSTEVLTGIVALIGIILWMFVKKTSLKNVGGIMLGFAVLMFGMSMMSGAIEPLREDPNFIHLLTSFTNPVLGVLAGLLVTAVIQSASAAVGILQALAVTGALEFDMAFPIIMGIGIGAAVPVMLSALGTSANGKRTAFVYLIIDIIGAILCGVIFYVLNAIFHFPLMTTTMTMVMIALVNTLYRLAVVILLAPATGLLEKLVCAMFPEGEEAAAEKADMDRLEPRFLAHPPLSIEQSRLVIDSMAGKALDSINSAIGVRRKYSKEGIKRVMDLEEVLDRYEDKLGAYLSKITAADLSETQSLEVGKYLTVLSDFERMSDHAKNIGEAATEINEKKLLFSEAAEKELSRLEDAIQEIASLTIDAFLNNDFEEAKKVDPLEEVVDDLCDILKSRHIDRVSRQECTLENGFVFNDILTDYERIADHCSNIALDLVEEGEELFHEHEYHRNMDYRQDPVYVDYFNSYKDKYEMNL